MKREQLISITANETTTSDGDALLAVVYRRHADILAAGTSLEGLQYHLISSVQDWDQQYNGTLEMITQQRCDVVSLTHTPRNLG